VEFILLIFSIPKIVTAVLHFNSRKNDLLSTAHRKKRKKNKKNQKPAKATLLFMAPPTFFLRNMTPCSDHQAAKFFEKNNGEERFIAMDSLFFIPVLQFQIA
jgi:hypothetical protein